MNRIDVHVLRQDTENPLWAQQCLDSLQPEPVNVWNVPGIVGDVRAARKVGFSKGNAEFVSFVDNDDWVNPGAFQSCLDVLDKNPGAVGAWTLSNIVCVKDGKESAPRLLHEYQPWPITRHYGSTTIHQLSVMRRDVVSHVYNTEYDRIPCMSREMVYVHWKIAQYGPMIPVNMVGYNWRHHGVGAHNSWLFEKRYTQFGNRGDDPADSSPRCT